MRNRPNRPQGVLPDPAGFPIGSVESRAAARRLLEVKRPLEWCVYTDEYGWPIYEPGGRYAAAVIELAKEMSVEEWTSLHLETEPTDPVEQDCWLRQRKERTELEEIQRAVWMERHGRLDQGLCTLPPEQERVQREKQRTCDEARERSRRMRW